MDTNRNIKTKGIVLSTSIYKESSKTIDLLTENYGRIRVFAQGALNPKKELLEVTGLFTESEYLISKVNNHYYVKEANLVNSNYELSKNVSAFMAAKFMGEMIVKTFPQELLEKNVFELTKTALQYLSKLPKYHKYIKVAHSLKYLSFIGFRPNVESCIECGIRDYDNMYFTHTGGLICSSCIEPGMEVYKLSRNEIELLNKLLYSKFSEFEFINTQSSVIIDKLDDLIYEYVLYCGELFELKSQSLYNRLNKS